MQGEGGGEEESEPWTQAERCEREELPEATSAALWYFESCSPEGGMQATRPVPHARVNVTLAKNHW